MRTHIHCLITLLAAASASLPATGQPLHEVHEFIASDTDPSDWFGSSVAISGSTAIVGAWGDDDGGLQAGAAYLFSVTTGQQLLKLIASDAAPGDRFANGVAISGSTAIVGAHENDDAIEASGSAYLFDTTTGQELFKLTASDASSGDRFGFSVAISGTTAIVGAGGNDDAGANSGSAYLFDTITGQELFKLTASDAAPNDVFGTSVAISGTTAIVGAEQYDYPEYGPGSAYLFDTTTGEQLFRLTASDATADDHFGHAVAISGTTAIVGAYWNDAVGNNVGSVYVFDTTTGQELFKLAPSDPTVGEQFGWSVSISGTTAVIGAQSDRDAGSESGSAYLFDTTTGQEISKLAASDAASRDRFGVSVGISGATAIVGAQYDVDVMLNTGSAFLYTKCPADLAAPFGSLNFFDIAEYIALFNASDPGADLAPPFGAINFFDIAEYIALFNAGCP